MALQKWCLAQCRKNSNSSEGVSFCSSLAGPGHPSTGSMNPLNRPAGWCQTQEPSGGNWKQQRIGQRSSRDLLTAGSSWRVFLGNDTALPIPSCTLPGYVLGFIPDVGTPVSLWLFLGVLSICNWESGSFWREGVVLNDWVKWLVWKCKRLCNTKLVWKCKHLCNTKQFTSVSTLAPISPLWRKSQDIN